ncbi:trafficking kinesin-binding protein 1 [Tachysurus ichikawai]
MKQGLKQNLRRPLHWYWFFVGPRRECLSVGGHSVCPQRELLSIVDCLMGHEWVSLFSSQDHPPKILLKAVLEPWTSFIMNRKQEKHCGLLTQYLHISLGNLRHCPLQV